MSRSQKHFAKMAIVAVVVVVAFEKYKGGSLSPKSASSARTASRPIG